jgi:predicted RecA/RadA family phage recombinase
MKNLLRSGTVLALVAPSALVSGQGFLVGDIFAVAATDAVSGAAVDGHVVGEFALPKQGGAGVTFAAGARVYWDAANSRAVATPTGNRFIGLATAAAVDAATSVAVNINHLTIPDPLEAVLTATQALDFPSIAAAASADLTVAVAGAVVGDAVLLGRPAAPTAGLIFQAFVSAADTVTVRATNITAGAVDAASQTFRVTVLRA